MGLSTPRRCKSGRHVFTGRQCQQCANETKRRWVEASDFSAPRRCSSGRHAYTGVQCAKCKAEKRAAWVKNNPDKVKAMRDAWVARHPERAKEQAKRSYRKRRAENPERFERVNAYGRAWHRANKERTKASRKAWREANLDKRAEQERRRRTRKNGGLVDLTEAQWEAILAWHSSSEGTRCAYCFGVCEPTLDHIVPISRGGDHTASNVVPACGSCNTSKHARELSKWVW